MFFIKSLKVTNFRGLADFACNLSPNINVIVGDNESGKTTVLEAISVGIGGFFKGFEGVQSLPFSHENVRRDAQTGYLYYESSVALDYHFGERGGSLIRRLRRAGARTETSIKGGLPLSERRDLPFFGYYGAMDRASRTQNPRLEPIPVGRILRPDG